ncbi:Hypothetical protein I5071_11660 [Sandaracinus amylolyticus]|nr:Hypothetical protein I5071_11660 [Sandaracinus amylolyticus]
MASRCLLAVDFVERRARRARPRRRRARRHAREARATHSGLQVACSRGRARRARERDLEDDLGAHREASVCTFARGRAGARSRSRSQLFRLSRVERAARGGVASRARDLESPQNVLAGVISRTCSSACGEVISRTIRVLTVRLRRARSLEGALARARALGRSLRRSFDLAPRARRAIRDRTSARPPRSRATARTRAQRGATRERPGRGEARTGREPSHPKPARRQNRGTGRGVEGPTPSCDGGRRGRPQTDRSIAAEREARAAMRPPRPDARALS